jgi:hypothetical protein
MGIPFRGLIHDMSKFSSAEFRPYAIYFFHKHLPKWEKIKKLAPDAPDFIYTMTKDYWEERFKLACLHHKRVNKHQK